MRGKDDFEAAEFGDPPARGQPGVGRTDAAASAEWWDLRTAEANTGVPVSTLRRWHRRGVVDSRLIDSPAGSRVQVRAGSVLARAAARAATSSFETSTAGSDVTDAATTRPLTQPASGAPSDQADPPAGPPSADSVADPDSHPGDPQSSAGTAPGGTPPATPPESGGEGILVPLDAWQRMLNQLGNLHDAGQQLAEARERAARAETEAAFLRERLAALRTTTAPPRPDQADEPPPPEAPQPDTRPGPGPTDPGLEDPVPRTFAGRAIDHVVDAARRAWHQRSNR